ncbi:vascular endothelial growth factor receptor 3 [Parasteatoda tepidariorum]|uniref:vascular endothelial growth factor receptor 3 n=1 Tax=Parasteatoda tepidariorum TaxID=114398 RepID=UPI0039BD3AD6
MNLSEPVVHQAGQNVKFVITVDAYPSSVSEIYWLKDGQLLQPDNSHFRIETKEKTVVLEIHHLLRSDAGNYTLVGKVKDVVSSISIILEVKDKPIVSVRNGEFLYKVGSHHTLECHADGYPAPILWWKWKPWSSSVSSYSYGWQDVEPNGNFPNGENVTQVKSLSLVSYLQVTAVQSGHYQCVASNVMGQDSVITPFIVTDADKGFEIELSEAKPVDKDTVDLICKVNTYNFSGVEWIWRPMDSNGETKSLWNIQDVNMSNSTTPYSHSSTIHFQPIHRNMSGEYECIAKGANNNNSTDSKHILIDVKEIQPPILNKTNLGGGITILIAPGSLQEFYCYSYGVPAPVTSWMKDGQMLDAEGADISENNQRLTIRKVMERDAGFYECLVQNRGGTIRANATLDIFTDNRDALHQNALTTGEITALIVFGVVAIILIFVVSCLVKRIMKEKKQKKELGFISHNVFERGYIDIFNPNLPLEDQIDLLPYKHNCEFPKERLKLGKTLGQGAFGRVVKAEAIGLVDGEATTTVAVKMLKDGADMEQRKALIAELKILIHIGKHVNIVNLLGAVTKNIGKGELYVIVEYCCYGNLRHFLLKHKGSYLNQLDHRQLDASLPASPLFKDNMLGMDNPTYRQQSLNYADLAHHQGVNDSGTGISVFTSPSGSTTTSERYLRSAFSLPSSTEDNWNEEAGITTCDLLCFAFQCARGMEYLASRKLIHRDLAARNVLLAKDNVVKICDFGLAKDCYKYSNYIKKTSGLLPIKWMAVESIRDRVFTSKSDTWSFGILLWEIFTLGGNPYPGVEVNEEFFKKLNNGYRMEKPDLAPDKIYQLMKNCWLDDPNQRPEFGYLAEQIGALLESSVRKYYVELNEPYQMMNEELLLNNNDYLQMAGMKMEEYTNMVPGDDPPAVIPLESLSPHPPVTNVTYLNMTATNEDSDFYQWRTKEDIPHYENGHIQVDCQEISTRC